MSGLAGMGVLGGGGGGGGGQGAQGGGLCVFSCSTFFSAIGAIAALYDYDLGPESAFFAVNGLGALCFAKCQYLRLASERSRLNRKQYRVRSDNWEGGGSNSLLGPDMDGYGLGDRPPPPPNYGGGSGGDYNTIRRRRDDTSSWEDEFMVPKTSKGGGKNTKNSKTSKGVGSVS